MRTEYDIDDDESCPISASVSDWFRAQFKLGVIGGEETVPTSAWEQKRKTLLREMRPSDRDDALQAIQEAPTLDCLRRKALSLNLGNNQPN